MSTAKDSDGLSIRHIEDEKWYEVKAQMHGEKRVSIWEKYLEWTPKLLALYARYDPDMIVEKHGHMSDHIVFVLDGEVTVGDDVCRAGTHIFLEKGSAFGPLVAGPEGALLYEIMMGDPRAVPADPTGFQELCASRGVVPLPNPPLELPEWVGERLD